MLLALLLGFVAPTTASAQSDGFFRGGNDNYQNRDSEIPITGSGIQNDDFGAPLGSGLLILTVVGAGYAVSKRRRNLKKGTTLLLSALMLLGLTGCKKKVVENVAPTTGDKVAITLNVGDGSKVNVEGPKVTFEKDDQILVAYDGKYVGTITHNGTYFAGNITITQNGTQPLYFYFLGNKDAGTLTAGSTTNCTVNISDQTSELPVISMSPSEETYPSEGNHYSASLHNKCSLMKFNVTTLSNSPICITGMNNLVSIKFSKAANDSENNGFAYDKDGEGIIKMKGGSGENVEKWAIVLQQDALDAGDEGSAYTEDYSYVGARAAVPAITMAQYLNEYRTMTVNTPAWDGDLSKLTDESTEAYATARNTMTIYGTLGVNKKVSIADGATVTLDNVVIQPIGYLGYEQRWAGITCLGDATIILKDGTSNTVKYFGDEGTPGIFVPENKTLTIQGNTGSLSARGEFGAAIGSGNKYSDDYASCGNIVINGGTVNVQSEFGAGIGSGEYGSCGNIVINGGTITTSNHSGAGIGCGYGGSCGNINITGGIITTGSSESGAGIGSCGSGSCGDITISGGTVNAHSMYGAGIGCSDNSGGSCGTITISGGNVNAQSEEGAGIGSGDDGSCGNIVINGGTVNARSMHGAGIGGGSSSACGDITITSGVTQVTATTDSMEGYNAIGKGRSSNACGTVTIGGIVYYDGSSYQNGGDTYLATKPLIYSAHYFSVSSTKQVIFALGNLQATYYTSPFSYWSWSIATHQWDYIGNAAGNTSINGNGTASTNNVTVDLFGWVGQSSSWNSGAARYGISNSTTASNYGTGASEALKYNWGNTIGTGWRTLTSDEWVYLLNTRFTTSGVRYAKATVNSVNGVILLPDNWNTSYYSLSSTNTPNAEFTNNYVTLSDWTTILEAHGAIFLPTAGYRNGSTVNGSGTGGGYWSSTSYSSEESYGVFFYSTSLSEAGTSRRYYGRSVRLVRDAN